MITGSISGNAATATTATSLAGTTLYSIPYQSAAATTSYLLNSTTAGYVLTSTSTVPTWAASGTITNYVSTTATANQTIYSPLTIDLADGQIAGNPYLKFTNENINVGGPNRISLFDDGTAYGFGMASNTLKYCTQAQHIFYTGSTHSADGTQRVLIDSTGITATNFWGTATNAGYATSAGYASTVGTATNAYNVLSGGNIVTGTITCYWVKATSDYRIKQDVQTLNDTYTVDKLRPVSYYNTLTEQPDIGLIAHELQDVYPFMVTGEKDGENNQAVNYLALIGILIKEIQGLKERVHILETNNK